MTLNIELNPSLEAMVHNKVAAGLYPSASDMVGEALRRMEAQDQNRAEKLATLRADIQESIHSGSAGILDIEAVIHRGHARLDSQV